MIGEIRRAPNAPAGAAALHAVADESEDIALHAAEPRVVEHARLAGIVDWNVMVIGAQQGVLVALIVRLQFAVMVLYVWIVLGVYHRLDIVKKFRNAFLFVKEF